MPPTFHSAQATVNESDSTMFTVSAPASVASGDLLIAVVGGGDLNTITPPAGWTALCDTAVGRLSGLVCYKIAGGSEPSTYDFTFSVARRGNAVMLRVSGVDTADPFDGFQAGRSYFNDTNHIAPSAYAFDDDCLLVCGAIGGGGGGFSYTPPSGVTEVADSTNAGGGQNGSCLAVGTLAVGAAGATGAKTWACNASLYHFGFSLLVRPSGAVTRDKGLYKSHATTRMDTAGTSFVMDMPAGVASGDLLIAMVAGGTSQTITPPAGWTAVESGAYGSSTGATFSRIAGGSEPSTYTFSFSNSNQATGGIVCFDGSGGTPTIDVSGITGGAVNSSPLLAPSLTTTVDGCTLLTCVVGGWGDGCVVRSPDGHIKLAERSNHTGNADGSAFAFGVEVVAVASSTGTRAWTPSESLPYTGMSIALTGGGSPGGGGTGIRFYAQIIG